MKVYLHSGKMNCLKCNNALNAEAGVSCYTCKRYIYAERCAGLTKQEIKCLNATKRNISYCCDNCKGNAETFHELRNLIMVLRSEVEALKNKLETTNTSGC